MIGSDPLPNVDGVLALWQRSMGSPDKVTAQKAFSALWVTTSHERLSDDDLTIKNRIYVSRLMEYPEDIVRDVVQTWSDQKGGEWFPSLKDITDRLKSRLKARVALGSALRAWGSKPDIERRIKLIRFDLSRADMGHQVSGCDVPGFIDGLQGKALADAMPRYREWADARIAALEALL